MLPIIPKIMLDLMFMALDTANNKQFYALIMQYDYNLVKLSLSIQVMQILLQL